MKRAPNRGDWPDLATRWLAALGMISWLIYLAIARLSTRFVYGRGFSERPIAAVLLWLTAAFLIYLAALWLAARARENRWLMWAIWLPAIAFRLTLLPTTPIQEIDIYRYVWDGAASTSGVSPYRYSPGQVAAARVKETLPDGLARLVRRRDGSASLKTIVSRVHYAHLPTIYPPTSQAVFALAAMVTPSSSSVETRLTVMKAFFVAFDLGTIAVVMALLRCSGRHVGWSVAYAWCPLVLKEIANGGHLDALAVFLTTLAVYAAVRGMFNREAAKSDHAPSSGMIVLAALTLALAVGAKLYPVVLAPLLLVTGLKRIGWRKMLVPTGLFCVVSALLLWPMMPDCRAPATNTPRTSARKMIVKPRADVAAQDPSLGLRTFLRRFEMNDFLFLLVVENLKPQIEVPWSDQPWFMIVPEAWRGPLLEKTVGRMADDPIDRTLLLARILIGTVFVLLVIIFTLRGATARSAGKWLRMAFLTLAWLWLLSPTQNPWYWLWALPFVPFARCRAWLLVSGLALAYYSRFWLIYHFADTPIMGTTYRGGLFFDYVVVWFEYAPLFLLLAAESVWLLLARGKRQTSHRRLGTT